MFEVIWLTKHEDGTLRYSTVKSSGVVLDIFDVAPRSGLVKLVCDDQMCYVIDQYKHDLAIQSNQPDVRANVYICFQQWTFTYVWELWIGIEQYTIMVVAVDWFDAERKLKSYLEANLQNRAEVILSRIVNFSPILVSNIPSSSLIHGPVCIIQGEVPTLYR